MKGRNNTPHSSVTPALEAITNLTAQELNDIFHSGQMAAMIANGEIELAPINRKSGIFHRHFVPLRNNLILLLANSYRRYFKVALAHPREAGTSPEQWAWSHLQSVVGLTLEWVRDWYILACDGENQSVRHIGQIPFVSDQTVSLSLPLTVSPLPPSESWHAPAWLFHVSIALVGVGMLKTKHVPETDSEQKLGAAHTRLLLKGARRVFLWELGAAIETMRDEEIAAAGAIPTEPISGERRASKVANQKDLRGLSAKQLISLGTWTT